MRGANPEGAWIVGFIFLGVVLLFWLITASLGKSRRGNLEGRLSHLGFGPLPPTRRKELLSAFQSLPLFNSRKRIFNLSMAQLRKLDSAELILFEIDTRIRGGMGQTVSGMALHLPNLQLPYFRWIFQPRHLRADRSLAPYLLADSNLQPLPPPGTSDSYYPGYSTDPASVRRILREDKIFELTSDFRGVLEGYGPWIFAYEPSKKINLGDIAAWTVLSEKITNCVAQRNLGVG